MCHLHHERQSQRLNWSLSAATGTTLAIRAIALLQMNERCRSLQYSCDLITASSSSMEKEILFASVDESTRLEHAGKSYDLSGHALAYIKPAHVCLSTNKRPTNRSSVLYHGVTKAYTLPAKLR